MDRALRRNLAACSSKLDSPHTVREFLEAAFAHAEVDWKKHVEIDPRYFRPAEVDLLMVLKAIGAAEW